MQTQNPFLDDLARMAQGVVGGLSGLKQEIDARLREQLERVLGRMDLVSREEFEVVRAMAAKARDEQEAMAARLAALEAKLATPPDRPA
ncbi:MAG: accessory factor UbiK family protein [Dongiaceae bacterium]